MARGINKVILIGNLGKDPEVRYMPSGSAVTNVTIATSETWKDKQSGDKQDNNLVRIWRRRTDMTGKKILMLVGDYVEERQQGLYRGQPANPEMAGQKWPGPLYDRDRCQ